MIQFMDNFQSYGTSAALLLNGVYAQLNNISLADDPDPLVAETVLRLDPDNDNGIIRKVLTTAKATTGVALRVWTSALPTDSNKGFRISLRDEDNQVHCYLKLITTGTLQFYNGDGTLKAASAGPVIIANAWQHIEMKVLISAAAGTVEVRVDGVTVITATGLDTANTAKLTCAQYGLQNFWENSGAATIYIRDYVLWDDAGAHNTDFLGSVTVYRLVPSADVTLGGWTTSSGATGYNLIDESPPVDTGYVQASDAPPAACKFSLTDLPVDVTSVRGLMTFVRMEKTDGGDATVQVGVVSGASTANGSDRPITTAFTYWFDIQETDPATAASWLPSAVNAAQLKINRTI